MELNKNGIAQGRTREEILWKNKLTVGILRGSKEKIQYCITAIEKTTAQPATTRNSYTIVNL